MEEQDFSLTTLRALNNSPYKQGVIDLLSFLPIEDVYSISQTASNKKVIPEDKKEAFDIILIYTPDLYRFFSYRRITNKILTQYLNVNNVILKGYATNHHLIASVKQLWAKKFPETVIDSDEKDREEQSNIDNSSDKSENIGENHKYFIKSDEFAHSFSEWFYSRLNNINDASSGSGGEKLNASMFCVNSKIDIYVINNSSIVEEFHSESDKGCEQMFLDVINLYKLKFLPNLDSGTRAIKSVYGPIKVLCCGTLYKGTELIGVFEEEFGLVQNPDDKNWKIFTTKVNLKTALNLQTIPSLPPCPVFDIECV